MLDHTDVADVLGKDRRDLKGGESVVPGEVASLQSCVLVMAESPADSCAQGRHDGRMGKPADDDRCDSLKHNTTKLQSAWQ